jgi:hypothetical protein
MEYALSQVFQWDLLTSSDRQVECPCNECWISTGNADSQLFDVKFSSGMARGVVHKFLLSPTLGLRE